MCIRQIGYSSQLRAGTPNVATAGQGIGEAPCGAETDRVSDRRGWTHVSVFTNLHIVLYWLSCDNVCADGMDREDSYPDQSCPMANHHQGMMAESHWEDLCSSASIGSQSSDEEMKPLGHSKGELYPTDCPSAVVNLLPHSGPSAAIGPPVDPGGPPYSGKQFPQALHQSCLGSLKGRWSLETL